MSEIEIRYVWGPGERPNPKAGKCYFNRWCIVEFIDPLSGKPARKALQGVTDKQEARSVAPEYLGAKTAERRQRQRDQAAGAPRTFRELADAYINDSGLARKRQAKLLKHLCAVRLASRGGQAFGAVPLNELKPRLAQQAANQLYGDEGCGTTKNRAVIGPFRAAIKWGARNEHVPAMEIVGFPEIKRTTPRPDPDDLNRLFAILQAKTPERCANKRSRLDHRYRQLIVLYWICQGWRIEESLQLTWDHVNLRAEEFQGFQVAKGAEVKDIDISTDIWEALAGLPEGEEARARAERHGRVFPWVNRHNVYRWLRPLCRSHGIKFTPHMARVEFASRLNEGGASPVDTVAVGTWTDPRSVERYIRVDKKTRKKTIAMACMRRAVPEQVEEAPAVAKKERSA